MRVRRAVFAALLALAPATLRAGEPDDPRIAERVARLRAGGTIERTFVETKTLALLAAPLESRGVMAFEPPDRLRWEIVGPEPSVLRIDGRRMELARPGARTRRLDLTADAGARGLVDAVRLLLAGDLAALRRGYALSLDEAGEGWRLALAPRDAAERRIVARIELAGAGDAPSELWLHFANGDLSHVAFAASR
jgi:hypothetical protein